LDGRQLTPQLVTKITLAGVKDRSEVEASKTLADIGGVKVSPKTVERVLHDVGEEITQLRDGPPSRLSRTLVPKPPVDAPRSVMVSADGGRMMTREGGQGPGVHNHRWRETKNATFERLTPKTYDEDPHPELPECFLDPDHVAKLAESASLEVTTEALEELQTFEEALAGQADDAALTPADAASEAEDSSEGDVASEASDACLHAADASNATPSRPPDITPDGTDENRKLKEPDESSEDRWQPERLFRTCLSSLVCSAMFGLAMAREAARRRFGEAIHKAFVADGLGWNWSIWRKYFHDYTPILDFVHVVEYLYQAACAAGGGDAMSWSRYVRWSGWCWQSRVGDVLAEIRALLTAAGIDPDSKAGDGPLSALHTTYRYLANNTSRMDYVSYRKRGLPVTSAVMESLVKQIHQRVKGTEMYWNDSQRGGEGIVQLRSSYLCDDDRLRHYLRRRPGHPYVRRSTKVGGSK
jgi:hypothetical protein